MSQYEFVFALISIITSLALTRLISGVVTTIRHANRQRLSLTHGLWVWTAFAVVVANWGGLWAAQSNPQWPAVRVLMWLVTMTLLYAFCALVLPEEDDQAIDLRQFHEREGRRYIAAHNLFAGFAILFIVALHGLSPDYLPDLVPAAIALVTGLVAMVSRGRVQLAASALVAALAASYMLATISRISLGPVS